MQFLRIMDGLQIALNLIERIAIKDLGQVSHDVIFLPIFLPGIRETLIAHVTLERLLTGVDASAMLGQLVGKQEAFAAPENNDNDVILFVSVS